MSKEIVNGIVILLVILSYFGARSLGPFTTPYNSEGTEINKALSPRYFYRPFSAFGQGSVDSIEVDIYKKQNREKYPDYIKVENWFSKKNRVLSEYSGNFYKVLSRVDERSVSTSTTPTKNEALYLFSANDNFYVLTFNILETKVELDKISRFSREYGKNKGWNVLWNDVTNKIYKQESLGKYDINFSTPITSSDLSFTSTTTGLILRYELGKDIFYEREFFSEHKYSIIDFTWSIICVVLWAIVCLLLFIKWVAVLVWTFLSWIAILIFEFVMWLWHLIF
jgi:hypothetical protein